jgi:hypothetical protein
MGATLSLNHITAKMQSWMDVTQFAMAYFKNKLIAGKAYDLEHLDPFDFVIAASGSDIKVHVEFGFHCFTEKLEAHHTPDLRYKHDGELRAFSIERYTLSLKLPDLLQTLGDRSVYHTKQGSFFILRDEDIDGKRTPYLVFFSAFKARNGTAQVRVLIRSAYLKPAMSERAAPVKFSTLIKFVRDGRSPPLGATIKLKRS